MSNGTSIINGTRHVGLVCSNIEKSIEFYKALGFICEGAQSEESGVFAELLVGIEKVIYKTVKLYLRHNESSLWQESGFRLELIEYVNPKSEHSSNFKNNVIGKVHLCFTVQKIDELIEKIIKHGGFVPFKQAVDDLSKRKDVYVFDPDKNPLELAENL